MSPDELIKTIERLAKRIRALEVREIGGGGGGGGGAPSGTVVAETSYGQASNAGAAASYSRGDHTHGTPALPDAADVPYTPNDNTHWDGDADPGEANDALDQLAERVDDLEAAPPAHIHDAADVTFTPDVLTDWDGDADPGSSGDALNQLAERVDDLEIAPPAHIHDAADVTYTPDDNTDWNGDADPGSSGDALDQLAERVDDLEAHSHTVYGQVIFTREGVVGDTAGTIRLYNHEGQTLTIVSVHADISTAPTGQDLIVDIHKGGITIFTTQANRPTIAAGANSSGAATPDITAWNDNTYLTCDVDQIGNVVVGADLTVTVVFSRTVS